MAKNKISKAAQDAQAMLDNPQDVKVRVTINLDGDLLDAIKERAAADGLKYQPWLNAFLRKVVLNGAASTLNKKDYQAQFLLYKSVLGNPLTKDEKRLLESVMSEVEKKVKQAS